MPISDNTRICLTLAGSMVLVAALCTFTGQLLLERVLPPPIATVDITSLLKLQQQKAARSIAGAATSDERQRHLRQAAAFGASLDRAIVALRQECDCILVLREAIVAGDVPDLTPRLNGLIDTR